MISAIITAAGKNRRMKEDQVRLGIKIQNKLLLDLHGKPVIVYTLECVQKTDVGKSVVILGHSGDKIKTVLENYPYKKVEVIFNDKKNVELSETLLNGVNHVKKGLCLCVAGDQPTVSSETMQKLIDAALRHPDDNIVSILARKDIGYLNTTEGLGMPFACHSSILKKYLPGKNDNINPILGDMINDGVEFFGVPARDKLELININHWKDYLKVQKYLNKTR